MACRVCGGTFLLIASYQIPCHAMLGDVRSARKCLSRMLEMADPARPMDMSHLSYARLTWMSPRETTGWSRRAERRLPSGPLPPE